MQANKLEIASQYWKQMYNHVSQKAPNEACGLLGGLNNQVRIVIPITNILNNQLRFRMDPKEQINAFNLLDKLRIELLAIYHSHPTSLPVPSITDLDEAFYTDAYYLIWWFNKNQWMCKGYSIKSHEFYEVSLETIPYQ